LVAEFGVAGLIHRVVLDDDDDDIQVLVFILWWPPFMDGVVGELRYRTRSAVAFGSALGVDRTLSFLSFSKSAKIANEKNR
jgi:hypothetical protein